MENKSSEISDARKKEIWDENDWNVYTANIKYMAGQRGLTMAQLSELMGVQNILRKDIKRPTLETLTKVATMKKRSCCHGLTAGECGYTP